MQGICISFRIDCNCSDIELFTSPDDTESNLEEQPELINNDPYGEGWIIKLKISDESELEKLLSAEEYQSQIS